MQKKLIIFLMSAVMMTTMVSAVHAASSSQKWDYNGMRWLGKTSTFNTKNQYGTPYYDQAGSRAESTPTGNGVWAPISYIKAEVYMYRWYTTGWSQIASDTDSGYMDDSVYAGVGTYMAYYNHKALGKQYFRSGSYSRSMAQWVDGDI